MQQGAPMLASMHQRLLDPFVRVRVADSTQWQQFGAVNWRDCVHVARHYAAARLVGARAISVNKCDKNLAQ